MLFNDFYIMQESSTLICHIAYCRDFQYLSAHFDHYRYDKLLAIGHTSVPLPSQKSGHLLGCPRNLGKVAYESSLPELSRHV